MWQESMTAPSCSTQPFGLPGVFRMMASPTNAGEPRDSRPSGFTTAWPPRDRVLLAGSRARCLRGSGPAERTRSHRSSRPRRRTPRTSLRSRQRPGRRRLRSRDGRRPRSRAAAAVDQGPAAEVLAGSVHHAITHGEHLGAWRYLWRNVVRSRSSTVPNQDHAVGVGILRQHSPTLAEHPPGTDLGRRRVDVEPCGGRMVRGLRSGDRAHAVDEPSARCHERRRCGEQSACRAASSTMSWALIRQRASARRRSAPQPGAGCIEQDGIERRATERRRGAVPGHDGQPRSRVRTFSCTMHARPNRWSLAITVAPTPASTVAFPPGAAHRSRIRSPGFASTAAATHWDDSSWT